MPSSNSSRDALLGQLADDFVARHRQGDRPALSEYTQRHPDLADDIRELFPALVQIERLKPAQGDLTGAFDGAPADAPRLERLGEYRILREVGRGGMGVVYEAEQESLGRHVALKVLPSSALLNPTYRERFKREAKAAARLHHTNIVPVFGVGEHDGVPYYAMQFIRGEGLDKVLADVRKLRGRLGQTSPTLLPPDGSIAQGLLTGQFSLASDTAPEKPPEGAPLTSGLTVSGPEAEYCRGVARIGAQVAEALAYAHKQGILHRDVKPSNLLLDAQGTVWVADFGLAKAEGSDELTGTGDIVGTLRFMAPERFDGRSLPQSDVYALGATLYELLTLRPAFDDANKAKLIDRALHEPPLAPRAIDARIPRDLETIVLKCLAKAPEERYATAEALAEDLHRFLADRPIQARRAGNAEKVWRWCRRNPALATMGAALLAVLVLTAVGGVVMSVLLNEARVQAVGDRDKAIHEEREGRLKLFESYLAEAKANLRTRRNGQRFLTLARVQDAVALARELDLSAERFAELRQIAITALAMPDLSPRYLGELSDDVSIKDLSDDLTRVLLWDAKAKTYVVRSVGDETELFRLPETKEWLSARFGAGGRYIIRHSEARGDPIEAWAADGKQPRLIRRDRFSVSRYNFQADGRLLAFSDPHGRVIIWDLHTGAEVRRLPETGERQPCIALHPTEPLLASCSYFTTRVLLRDARTGAVLQNLDPPWPMGSSSLAWRPDGQRLFVAAGDSTEIQEYHFDAAKRQLRPGRLLRTPWNNGGNMISINRTGDRLVNKGWSGAPGLLDLETGQALFSNRTLGTLTDHFRFSPDDRSLIGTYALPRGKASYGVIDVGDSREVRTIFQSKPGAWVQPAVHPGGRLAVVPHDNHLTFVDLVALRELAVVPRGSHRHINVAFDAKGRLYTNSFEGCFRWPIQIDGERLTVGPPERLPFQPSSEGIAISADGQTVAMGTWLGYGMANWAGGWLLSPDRPGDPIYLTPGRSIQSVSVTRDGQFACFSADAQPHVVEGRTGKLVWRSPHAHGRSLFTPDGRWLVSDARACRVGKWDEQVVLDPSRSGTLMAVSPDSQFALLKMTANYARLVEIATGREVARIDEPGGEVGTMIFSPDGTKILEPISSGLRVWDLRRIRRQLDQLGLDWDAPAYPPEPPTSLAPEPLQLTIHGGDLLSNPAKLAEYDRAQMQARLAKDPFDADGNLYLARQLLNQNRPGEALRHLERALLSRPRSYPVRMNRALCLVRLGSLLPALADYTVAVAARPEDYRPFYRRAQLYRRLGQHGRAADDLTAVLKHFPEDAELYAQRAACYAQMGDKDKEKADRAAALRWQPRSATGMNNRAWALATGPPAERDIKRALELIRKAIEINPNQATYHNTLGVALYRDGQWTQAVAALEKSLALHKGTYLAYDLYFLAMAHARSGEPSQAKECFGRAVKWHAEARGLLPRELEELQGFRQEAEVVLGIKKN